LATLQPETIQALKEILPAAASLHNPIDMLASATPEHFAACLRILLTDPEADSVMVIYPSPPMHTAGAVAKAIIPVIHQAEKPVVVSVMGERLIQEAVEHLRAARIPEYRFPERAAAALAALVERAMLLDHARAPEYKLDDVDRNEVSRILRTHNRETPRSAAGIQQIFQAYRIPAARMELAESPDQAVSKAVEIGLPVALKVASGHISHKTDVGGVLLNLADQAAIKAGYKTIIDQAQKARPEADIAGVYVQEMAPSGQEVIIGAVQDPQFGPLMMFGSGGTEVEGLRDIAFGLAPLTNHDAEDMLACTWAGRRLKGYRSIPPADRESVKDVLFRLAQLAADFPEFSEIEINPLRVLPAGNGCLAVDVRIQRDAQKRQ
jgi:acetyltransferase